MIATFGCALQGGAVNLAMLAVGRAIAGVAVGILSGVIPMYCAEIATAEDRGKLSGLLQLMLSWGFFAAQWIGFGSFHSKSDFQCEYRWRDQPFPLRVQLAKQKTSQGVSLFASRSFPVSSWPSAYGSCKNHPDG